jgi:hypothetical protein
MSCTQQNDRVILTIGSTRKISHNVTDAIDSGVTIASVSGVVDDDSTGELTIGNIGTNSAAYTEQATTDVVAIGKAVQFTISTSATSAKNYKLKMTYTTNATPADTIVDFVNICFAE